MCAIWKIIRYCVTLFDYTVVLFYFVHVLMDSYRIFCRA